MRVRIGRIGSRRVLLTGRILSFRADATHAAFFMSSLPKEAAAEAQDLTEGLRSLRHSVVYVNKWFLWLDCALLMGVRTDKVTL